jgi:RecJ-like exonuclease
MRLIKQYVALVVMALALVSLSSCARMDQREARYNPKQCPFCTQNPGVCFYCNGSKKCSFCKGTGTRTTVSPPIAESNLSQASYQEKCPYCKASGVCRYCDGVGKCWACKGTARIESWDFYEQYKAEQAAKTPEVAPVTATPDTTKPTGAVKK